MAGKTAATTSDRLKAEGLGSRGFGNVPKFVMLDTGLSLEAKGIYAYLCSFAGGGETAFPGLSKITFDLRINKDTYYKHFRQLTENGYIKVIKNTSKEAVRGQRFSNNVYILVSSPEKFKEAQPAASGSVLRYTGMKSSGYGQVNKAVMTMQCLCLKAKGMYAYYAAFTGAGESAFPKQEVILYHTGVSRNSLNKYNNELIQANVLAVVQRKTNGAFSVNDYYLIDGERAGEPVHKISEAEAPAPMRNISETEKGDTLHNSSETEKPDTEKPLPKISETNNNSSKTNRNHNKQSSQSAALPPDGGEKTEERFVLDDFVEDPVFNTSWSKDETARALKMLLDYDRFADQSTYSRFEDGEIQRNTFILFYEALLSMLTCRVPQRFAGEHASQKEIAEKVGRYIKRTPAGKLYLDGVGDDACARYRAGCSMAEIKKPLAYMKSCIYEALTVGASATDAQIMFELSR